MTAVTMSPEDVAKVVTTNSVLFGQISIPVDQCLTFGHGLLGFSPSQRFAVLPAAPDGVYWLQGVDDGSLAFLVVDPHAFIEDYSFDTDDIEGPKPVVDDTDECAVLCIVTLPRQPGETATANVQGPVFIDFSSRKGWQLILKESSYGTRHPINLSLPTNDKHSSSDA